MLSEKVIAVETRLAVESYFFLFYIFFKIGFDYSLLFFIFIYDHLDQITQEATASKMPL